MLAETVHESQLYPLVEEVAQRMSLDSQEKAEEATLRGRRRMRVELENAFPVCETRMLERVPRSSVQSRNLVQQQSLTAKSFEKVQ